MCVWEGKGIVTQYDYVVRERKWRKIIMTKKDGDRARLCNIASPLLERITTLLAVQTVRLSFVLSVVRRARQRQAAYVRVRKLDLLRAPRCAKVWIVLFFFVFLCSCWCATGGASTTTKTTIFVCWLRVFVACSRLLCARVCSYSATDSVSDRKPDKESNESSDEKPDSQPESQSNKESNTEPSLCAHWAAMPRQPERRDVREE